jgi:FtsP/CotA-like multicopper oxidase with cupredoxin domain
MSALSNVAVNRFTAPACFACGLLFLLSCAPATNSTPTHTTVADERAEDATRTAPSAMLGEVPQPPFAEDLDPDPNTVRVELRAQIISDDDTGRRYGYNGISPGPTIVAKPGDRVIVELINELPDPTTIHWHGLHVPFAMDGVVWQGAPVAPGATFTYEFVIDQAPLTSWYHPHFNTAQQVDGGLFGAFIVEDPRAPVIGEDLLFILDSVDEYDPNGPDLAAGHGQNMRRWQVNGVEDGVLTLSGGSVVRARFLNVSNHGYALMQWPGEPNQIASDQGLLPALAQPRDLALGAGDRVEVVWLIGEESFDVVTEGYSLNGGETRRGDTRLMRVEVDSPAAAPPVPSFAFSGEAPSANPDYADIVYALAGSDRSDTWRINGEAFPNVTIETVPAGEARIIEVRNLSPTEHPFHIHGMSFEVLSVNGEPVQTRTIEDTINIGIRDIVRLRIETSNIGDWMTHCHILEHADSGMMTVLRVE